MPPDLRARIRRSLADPNLQAALDQNARRRMEGRMAAFASLPDHAARRARAHAVKEQVVVHLDANLERFLRAVNANGIRTHQAADAAEALGIILGILEEQAAAKGASNPGEPLLVAKSKSMVSEEIELNHALEARGMRVVETDLGEYIVQLRGERPSHIITPAVHLQRGDVGRLFAEKLDLPYTEDIPTLTQAARKVLRRVFLDADVGISGVNFGVVDTGTLCLVTNEGNGRMVTTLPSVHIALMGIERLVPSLDDLALFLSLLPRSATGQKLSVYTSLINAPLPGQTRHLILLDNGRRALSRSPLAESLSCIRCGACLNACPVFREMGGHAYGSIYPGPIGAVISGALVHPDLACLAQASTLCGACRAACPVDIDLPSLLLRVRAGDSPMPDGRKGRPGAGVPFSLRLGLGAFRHVAARAWSFALFQRLGALFSRLVSPLHASMRLPAWTGWGFSKDLPRLADTPFRRRWRGMHQQVITSESDRIEANHSVVTGNRTEPAPAPRSLVAQFSAEVSALGGQVSVLRAGNLPGRLAEFLFSRGIERVCVDEAGAALVRGVEIVPHADPDVTCGVTGALCGIADSGSLLLASGNGETLSASLLPAIHVAVLKASRLVATLAEARPLLNEHHAAMVLVSGPSRTADIEMTLTIGVHGPGELHVFLIDDS
jgi:L-lactate dehydrogenase complex protein LldF